MKVCIVDQASRLECVLENYYPHAFLKKRRGYCNRLRLSVMLSPPKPLDEIQPNLVCELHEWGVQCQTFLTPPPEALGRGQKVRYNLISISKSISKIFIPNFVCVLTNERYKTYQMGFSFCHLGHVPGVGLWGIGGAQRVNFFFFFFKHGHVAYQIAGDDEQNRMQVKFDS